MASRFAEGLELLPLYAEIKVFEGRSGHPPSDPRLLAALTPSKFRVGRGAVLEGPLLDSFAALLETGVAGLDRAAQDGMRVPASAGAASFRQHATLRWCHRPAKQAVAGLRHQIDADPGAAARRQAAGRVVAAEDRERRLADALAITEALGAEQQERARMRAERAVKRAVMDGGADPAKQPRTTTTDSQAPVMNMADGGFAKLNDIEPPARAGVVTYLPAPAPRDKSRERHAPRPDDVPEETDW